MEEQNEHIEMNDPGDPFAIGTCPECGLKDVELNPWAPNVACHSCAELTWGKDSPVYSLKWLIAVKGLDFDDAMGFDLGVAYRAGWLSDGKGE
jgi:hypothetical protein